VHRDDAGVTLHEDAPSLVEATARRGAEGSLAAALGCTLPVPMASAAAGPWTILGTAARRFLFDGPADADVAALVATVSAHATAVEVSDARVGLSLDGPAVRFVLAKGCRIDLDRRAFGPGAVAETVMWQVPVLIHRPGAGTRFRLLVPSSLAVSFVEALRWAARDVGLSFARA